MARQRQHAADIADYHHRLAQHQDQLEQHQRDDAAWHRRRTELTHLLDTANNDTGSIPSNFAAIKLKRDERVYCTVPGSMVDMRSNQGVPSPTVVDHGQVTVTTARVVFNGTKKREWPFDKLQGARHVGTNQTMLNVSNRKSWSGVTYTDAEGTRTYITLAAADTTGTRRGVIDDIGHRLHDHTNNRPQPPTHPGPPPARPEADESRAGSFSKNAT